MQRTIILLFFLSFLAKTTAQPDTTASFAFSGYGELYYQYDFAKPDDHERPGFLYNHKRHNEVNLNLAIAKAAYASQNMRANLALMVGNYAQYNLAAEPVWAQHVFEANAGVKLSKAHNLWLDAGIMPSHIGFESAIGADCWTLTRSLVAENSPYFETGAKLSFANKKENLTLAALVLNGWQRTHRPDGYNKPAFGFQFNSKLTDQLTVNYSNFIGSDKPDSFDVRRFYHDFYAVWTLENWGITAGCDIGSDESYGTWLAPVLILRWSLSDEWRMAARAEYFHDPEEALVTTNTEHGFQTWGYSINLDFLPFPAAVFRLEGRLLRGADAIFLGGNTTSQNNFALALALATRF